MKTEATGNVEPVVSDILIPSHLIFKTDMLESDRFLIAVDHLYRSAHSHEAIFRGW